MNTAEQAFIADLIAVFKKHNAKFDKQMPWYDGEHETLTVRLPAPNGQFSTDIALEDVIEMSGLPFTR